MTGHRNGYGALGSRDIAQLLAVADHGSIRRAADALGMTQPGLSKNIKLIEERLGLAVFERSTTGALPTEAGALLLRRGRQILLDLEAIHRDLHDDQLADAGRVRIGVGPIPAPVISSQVIARCQHDYPDISIEMTVGMPDEQFARLERGEIDMFIGTCDHIALPDNIRIEIIDEITPVFFARTGHPLTGAPRVTLRDLAPWKLAHLPLHPPFTAWYCAKVGIGAPAIGFQCDDFGLIGEVVAASDMLSCASPQVLARLQRHHAITALDIAGIDYRHRVHCAHVVTRPLSRAAQRVLALARAAFLSNPVL